MKKFITTLVLTATMALSMATTALATQTYYFNGEYNTYKRNSVDRQYKTASWAESVNKKYDLAYFQNPNAPALRGEVFFTLFRTLQLSLNQEGYEYIKVKDNYIAKFKDLDSLTTTAKKEVDIMAYYGTLTGNSQGNMEMNKPITRAEFAAIITRMDKSFFDFNPEKNSKSFSDIPNNAWYKQYVNYVYQLGLMQGKSSSKFDPNGNITIQEMVIVCDNIIKRCEKQDTDFVFVEGAFVEAITGTLDVTAFYDANPVTSVKIDSDLITVGVGEKVQAKATVKPSNATNAKLNWKVNDESIAKISSTGEITGIKAGETWISAQTANGEYDSIYINVVKKVEVEKVQFSSEEVTLEKGESKKLTVNISPSDAKNATLEWKSNDTSIATVDKYGKVTAVKEGETWISAQAESGKYDTIYVFVESKDDNNNGNDDNDDNGNDNNNGNDDNDDNGDDNNNGNDGDDDTTTKPEETVREYLTINGFERSSYTAKANEILTIKVYTSQEVGNVDFLYGSNIQITKELYDSGENEYTMQIKIADLTSNIDNLLTVTLKDGNILTSDIYMYN